MKTFEKEYGFEASIRKWKSKLDEWKFSTNLRTDRMLFVFAKREKRAVEEGKDTMFFHEGSQIKRHKIEGFKRRNMRNQKAAENIDAIYATQKPQSINVQYSTPS
ncbi:hypothetical protein BJ875DRAFT_547981 [Amylocarpus encephaloides]|uniref:Clr5 domain-containing protein n=1 Tax=Amylocarpus encephaloides TaxID=45428 RepID=A0A9P8BYM9_9HELO|nr:hypothetical protein BJ875DRAFT_547981 [Amylocarpus encephaloides]